MPLTAQEIIPSGIAKSTDIVSVTTELQSKATELTQQDIKLLLDSINGTNEKISVLSDTLLYFVSAMLEKMPRLDINDRATVNVETGTVTVGTISTITNMSNLNNMNNLNNLAGGNTNAIPYQLSNVGTLHIYDNIKVT